MKKLYQHGKEIDKGKLLQPVIEFDKEKPQQSVGEFKKHRERMELLQKKMRETKWLMKTNNRHTTER